MIDWLKRSSGRTAAERAARCMQGEARAYGAWRREGRPRPGEVTDRGAKQALMAELILAVGAAPAVC